MKFTAPALVLVLAALALGSLSLATGRLVARTAAHTEEIARLTVTAVDLAGRLDPSTTGTIEDENHPFARAVAELGGRILVDGPIIVVVLDGFDAGRDRRAELRLAHGRVIGVRFVDTTSHGAVAPSAP
ncbi:MAG: hypothetical protein ACOC2D_00400 [Spirochaetota bacterium]